MRPAKQRGFLLSSRRVNNRSTNGRKHRAIPVGYGSSRKLTARKPQKNALDRISGLFCRLKPLSLVLDHVFNRLVRRYPTIDRLPSRHLDKPQQRLLTSSDETVEVIRP